MPRAPSTKSEYIRGIDMTPRASGECSVFLDPSGVSLGVASPLLVDAPQPLDECPRLKQRGLVTPLKS